MRTILSVAAVTGVLFLAGPSAQAAPGAGGLPAVAGTADITLVSGGCGPRGFRDRFGRCVFRRPAYAPPPGRRCPPGYRPTPYGCRAIY